MSEHTSSTFAHYLIDDNNEINPEFASAWATAYSDYGVLKVFSSSSGNSSGSSNSHAEFGDSILIDSPGLTGQTGSLFVNLKSTVTLGGVFSSADTFTGFESGVYGLQLLVGDSQSIFYEFDLSADRQCNQGCNAHESAQVYNRLETTQLEITPNFLLEIPFTFGQGLNFYLIADSRAASYGAGLYQVESRVDSSHSTYWGGINQLLDENGNPVTDFTISSTSGTNYLNDFSVDAVPEPETYAMLLAGLGLVGFVSRRRSKA